jgi:pimeloyl-ACP methyl ester carboxylesterase
MDETRIAIPDGDIFCVHAGRSEAPALIMLHGWTLDHRVWGPQIEAFARDRIVLAPDRRGFGASTAPADLAREADDVIALLDHFCIQRATIVGMSQAGRVALDFALRFSERVSGLVLQGAPASGVTPGPDEDETIPIVAYAALVRAGRLEEMKRRWREHPLMRTREPTAAAHILDAYAGRDLGAESYLRDAAPQDLAGIAAPALVITGARDTPWRRRAGDALAHTLANAERAEIVNAGHLCNLDQPEAFNRALSAFLARIA